MSFPRYPEYKDSGVEWLGDVPAHWSITRFKLVFSERMDRSERGDELLLSVSAYTGVSPRSEVIDDGDHLSRAESLEGYKKCFKDDLVMNIMLAWNRGLAFTSYDGIVSPAYCVFRVIDGSDPKFLNYLVRSNEYTLYFKAFSTGVIDSRLRIYPETFGALFCALPSLGEQKSIATFLDRETAKIDALVAEQEKLIALLQEKRQAVISHAVTKGLDPNVPMKDSGVEWLGEVSVHWEVCALRRVIAAIEQGWSPECYAREAEEQEWGVLKAGCLNGGNFRPSENKALPPELPPEEAYEVRVGDVLMSRASGSPELVGSTALVKATRERLMLSDKIFRLKLKEFVNAAFFVAALNSRPLRIQIENALSGGNGMANNLPQSSLLTFAMAVPPLAEQATITVFLEQETAKLDTLTAEARSAITLLQERRTALISAAVTGQIDVRGMFSKEVNG